MTRYELALKEVENGNLKVTKQGDYELFCYTQDCFFGKDSWNNITESHRGALYYKGIQVNAPFKKIFNLNERPETEESVVLDLINNGSEFNIYDKANGHLFIVSAFVDDNDEQQVVMHTKGSLLNPDNELLAKDIELFCSLHGKRLMLLLEKIPCVTLMFEVIADYDKHTMYDKQAELYGKNSFVLLAAHVFEDEWMNTEYDDLKIIAEQVLGCSIVQKYESLDGLPSEWLNHTDREGYVIHFLDEGLRVKIKTKEYWTLRFKKDLNAENIVRMFRRNGFNQINTKLPEEVAEQIIEVLHLAYDSWYLVHHVKVGDIPKEWNLWLVKKRTDGKISKEDRATLFKSDLPEPQKQYILSSVIADNELIDVKYKVLREEFERHLYKNSDDMSKLQNKLEKIVEQM